MGKKQKLANDYLKQISNKTEETYHKQFEENKKPGNQKETKENEEKKEIKSEKETGENQHINNQKEKINSDLNIIEISSPVKRTVIYDNKFDIKVNLIAKIEGIKKDTVINSILSRFFEKYKIDI